MLGTAPLKTYDDIAALGREGHDVSWCPTGESALVSVGPESLSKLLGR